MARKKSVGVELKDQRIPIMMTASELEDLDEWMHENRIRSRGEAIRRLCHVGTKILPHIEIFMDSPKRAYEQVAAAFKESKGKSDAERLEIYERCLSSAVPELLQAMIDANTLREIFKAAGHGETIDDALTESIRVLEQTMAMTERVMKISGDIPEEPSDE